MNVSLEQVLQWNPDTIITTDRGFAEQASAAAAWANVAAVQRQSRVLVSPSLPYGWINGPPYLNRSWACSGLPGCSFRPGCRPTSATRRETFTGFSTRSTSPKRSSISCSREPSDRQSDGQVTPSGMAEADTIGYTAASRRSCQTNRWSNR